MTDFNTEQMRTLVRKQNVTVVYLHAEGDYWAKQQEFCDAFRQAPLSHNVVIHVQFEGLSLTQALVVPAVEKIIKETGRDKESVYIFSPNQIRNDAYWENLFWKQFKVSDEFTRSKLYWEDNLPSMEDNFKTWAMFVGRRTTPRLLALYNVWRDSTLNKRCLLSIMNAGPSSVQIFDNPDKIYDQLDDWLPISNNMQRILEHTNFRKFCSNIPFGSIDNYSITDQYTDQSSGENRNPAPSKSLINLSGKYLFEITFETMTRGFTFTPSEKTVRTIVAQKPLVVYAPKNFLENLRKLGFETFGSLWDESYDLLEGPERYQAIMQIVRQVCAMSSNQQLDLYQKSREICQHNRNTLSKLIKLNTYTQRGFLTMPSQILLTTPSQILKISCHVRPGASALTTFTLDNIEQTFELSPTINWVDSSTTTGSKVIYLPLGKQVADKTIISCKIKAENNDVLICGIASNFGNLQIYTQPSWDDPSWKPYDISGHTRDDAPYNGNGSLQILAGQTVEFDAIINITS